MKKVFATAITVAMVGVMGTAVLAAEGATENRRETRHGREASREQRMWLGNIFEGIERGGGRNTPQDERIFAGLGIERGTINQELYNDLASNPNRGDRRQRS